MRKSMAPTLVVVSPRFARGLIYTASAGVLLSTTACGPGDLLYSSPKAPNQPDDLGSGALNGGDCPNAAELAKEVKTIFVTRCYRCHGENGQFQSPPSNILDVDVLTAGVDADPAQAYVVPGDPSQGTLLLNLEGGWMPKESAKLPDAQIDAVRDWIECGAPAFEADPPRTFIEDAFVLKAVLDDLERLSESERRYTRYLSIVHLYNGGTPTDTIAEYRPGLAKLLASLTHEVPRNLIPEVVPVPFSDEPSGDDAAVTETGLLFRINLQDYGWVDGDYSTERRGWYADDGGLVDAWELALARYPYGIYFDEGAADAPASAERAALIREYTHSRLPIIRADWFAAAASQPPLYFDILEIGDTLEEFYQLAGARVERSTELVWDPAAGEDVERPVGPSILGGDCAGFAISGVSSHNRVMCRVEASKGYTVGEERLPGYCWTSYDFASDVGRQNVFAHPVDFLEDGGEVICSLRTGQQIYLIVDAQGRRLDRAPSNVVVDPDQDPNEDGDSVTTGLSCMRCHERGIRERDDEVKRAVDENREAYIALYGDAFLGEVGVESGKDGRFRSGKSGGR